MECFSFLSLYYGYKEVSGGVNMYIGLIHLWDPEKEAFSITDA